MSREIKIFVVDDEENVLSSVKKVLKTKAPDISVELCSSPEKAVGILEDNEFDLVITDLMMPGIDGLELIKRILKIKPDIKIIMMTGYATMKTALLAMKEGANKYISKPFTRDELMAAVNEVLFNKKD